MSAPTSDPWRDAASFDELVRLGRDFLRGQLDRFPGWGAGDLDDESDALEDVLVAITGLGMLTVASQPGRPFSPGHDGRDWAGRAFVGGFASADGEAQVRERAVAEGLVVLAEPAGGDGGRFSVPAGLRDGLPYLVLETGGREAELEIFLKEVGPDAHRELSALPFLWIVDPVWGRRDALHRAFTAPSGV
ncbi:MAG: hypothetical protein AAF957_19225 [Planctomycetota bacterium]